MASRSTIGCLLMLAALTSAAEPEAAVVPIERFELSNGMTFLVVERPRAATVAAGWVVESGSADDTEGRSGLAHLLEHLLFKGSGKLRTGELDVLYARAGATGLNAVTQHDFTAYFVSLPAPKLELWYWLESDRLLAPALEGLRSEKQVVREERRLRTEVRPTGLLEEALSERLWGDHPYGRPVSGDPRDLEAIEAKDVRAHFESRYAPHRITAVLVGAVEAVRARELAELYFTRLPVTGRDPGIAPSPARGVRGRFESTCDCRTQARVLYESPRLGDEATAALEVLVAVLNGRSGRLHRSLVLEQGVAFAAFAAQQAMRRGGQLSLTVEGKGSTGAAELLEALDRQLGAIRSEEISPAELAKAKTRLRAEGLRDLREPSEVMLRLLTHAGSGRPEHINGWLRSIEEVSAAEVRRVAARVLDDERRAVGLFERAAEGASS